MSTINTKIPLLHRLIFWISSLFFGITPKFKYSGTSIISADSKTKFIVRNGTMDKFAVWEVWKLREYETPKQNDIVVDIGAQIGTFTVYAAQRAHGGKVFAYEPLPENFEFLNQNIKLNHLKNVISFQLAVSSTSGGGYLFIQKHNSGGHSVYNSGNDKKISIEKITLGEIFTQNKIEKIDFLKIDTEGSEYDILLNASKDILSKIGKIIIEYHDYYNHGHNYHDIETYLKASGFKVKTKGYCLQQQILKTGFIKAYR